MKVPSGVGEGFKRCSPINPTLSLTADNGQNKKKEIEIMFIWNRNEQLNICWLDADAGSVDFVIMCLYVQRAETNFWIPLLHIWGAWEGPPHEPKRILVRLIYP